MSFPILSLFSRRSILASALFVGLVPSTTLFAQDKPKEIRIDWATYNPVSLVLKDQGLLEKEFAKDGITIRWVQSAGSNKALEFLNASSLDFGSSAGSAALVARINGNPIKSIYVYSRPEWTALVTGKNSNIAKIEDLKGKRVAVTRGTDPHIFLVRALQSVNAGADKHMGGAAGKSRRRRPGRRAGRSARWRARPASPAGRRRRAVSSWMIGSRRSLRSSRTASSSSL